MAGDRDCSEQHDAHTLRFDVPPGQERSNDRPFALIVRVRTAHTGAGPFSNDVAPLQDGVDAGCRTGGEPGAGVADARQGPAGQILTAGARGALNEMRPLRLGGVTHLVLRGKQRACARVPCDS